MLIIKKMHYVFVLCFFSININCSSDKVKECYLAIVYSCCCDPSSYVEQTTSMNQDTTQITPSNNIDNKNPKTTPPLSPLIFLAPQNGANNQLSSDSPNAKNDNLPRPSAAAFTPPNTVLSFGDPSSYEEQTTSMNQDTTQITPSSNIDNNNRKATRPSSPLTFSTSYHRTNPLKAATITPSEESDFPRILMVSSNRPSPQTRSSNLTPNDYGLQTAPQFTLEDNGMSEACYHNRVNIEDSLSAYDRLPIVVKNQSPIENDDSKKNN
ncbi:hypothetical protein HYV10_03050 [Candidatus Dependentiae bacterium]|nr:hypothetical protein [Candidatus Dependentiae bacterium]